MPTFLTCLHAHTCLACLCVNMPCMLTCQRALLTYVLTCQPVLHGYVLTCQRALHAYMLTCQHALCPLMPTCLECLHSSHVNIPCVLMYSQVNVVIFSLTRLVWPCNHQPICFASSVNSFGATFFSFTVIAVEVVHTVGNVSGFNLCLSLVMWIHMWSKFVNSM